MRRGVGVLLLLLLAGGAGASPKYPDEAVTYYFDLTSEGDKKPTTLSLKLPAMVWQHSDYPIGWAPGTAVRKGRGAAWWYIDDHQAPGTAAHAYLEIENLGTRKLKKAVEDAIANLASVCKGAEHSLQSPPGKPERIKVRIGRKRVLAYRIQYTVSPPPQHGQAVFHSTALLFSLNKRLVTLTVDNMGRNKFFDVFAKGLGLVKKRARQRAFAFKLFSIDRGVSRFLALQVPSGFRRVYGSLKDQKLAAVFERPKTRFTVRVTVAPKTSLRDVMEKWLPELRAKLEDFKGPKELMISGRVAYEISFRRDKQRVRRVYIRIVNQDYTLSWETEADQSEAFNRVVASTRVWRSRVD